MVCTRLLSKGPEFESCSFPTFDYCYFRVGYHLDLDLGSTWGGDRGRKITKKDLGSNQKMYYCS
jgi:hypothetical protein